MQTLDPRRTSTAGMSVIISAWGVPKLLPSCLESFAAQENKAGLPLEIVLGFDGCTETRDAFLEMPPQGISIRPYWFPENHGPYVVFNTLITLARHPYLLFFGADDLALSGLTDAHCAMRMGYALVQQTCSNAGRASCGAFGVWIDAVEKVGGYRAWRCQADSDFRHRIHRARLPHGIAPGPLFQRRTHPRQLTRAEETRIGSPLRAEYRRLSKKVYAKDVWVEPVIAACVPLAYSTKAPVGPETVFYKHHLTYSTPWYSLVP